MTDQQKNLLLTVSMGTVLSVIFNPSAWWLYPFFYIVSYPYSHNGHIVSLWGGSASHGSIGSLFCIYQESGNSDTVCIFCLGVQKSMRDAVAGGGICLLQQAKDCSHFGVGLAVTQRSDHFSRIMIGLVAKQSSLRDVKLHFGVAVLQEAGERFRGLGLALKRIRYNKTASQ